MYLLSNLQTNVEAHLSFLLHFSFLCLPALASKVPCCRVVELARAEVSGNPRPNAAVKRFAKIPVEDAEAGCHELFRELGLCAPVKVEYPTMDGMKSIPYIRISSWAQWLLDTNRLWRQFVGVGSWERMQVVLGEYWARFRELYPNHGCLLCLVTSKGPFLSILILMRAGLTNRNRSMSCQFMGPWGGAPAPTSASRSTRQSFLSCRWASTS